MKNKYIDNNLLADFVIELINRTKNNECTNVYYSPKKILIYILRDLPIKEDNIYISKKAKNKWKELGNNIDDFNNYTYVKRFKNNSNNKVKVKIYKGNYNKGEVGYLEPNKTIEYRKVFHDDHIIPISIIVNELCKLTGNGLNRKNVLKILNEISICKMLKEEDRTIKEKYIRSFNKQETINKIYKKYGIKIEKFDKRSKMLN